MKNESHFRFLMNQGYPQMRDWLWKKHRLRVEHLLFLLDRSMYNSSDIPTPEKVLNLYVNGSKKDLSAKISKMQRSYIKLVTPGTARPNVRDRVLEAWAIRNLLIVEELESFMKKICDEWSIDRPENAQDIVKNRFLELVIMDEIYVLKLISQDHSHLELIDSRIKAESLANRSMTDSELEVEITREMLDAKYKAINAKWASLPSAGPLIEFQLPARSWQNRWRKPF